MMRNRFFLILTVAAIAIVAFFVLTSGNQQTEEVQQEESTMADDQTAELVVEDTVVGDGAEVKSGDTVVIHYSGTLEDGTQFDSSYDRGQPFETAIGVGRVIEGWDKGVVGMKVGGKRRLVIPPSMGYGAQSIPGIPPNSTLTFEVELVDVK